MHRTHANTIHLPPVSSLPLPLPHCRPPQAVTFFEKFFETARTLSDRKMLDVARVNLGVARGSLRMRAYMGIVAHDLPALIAWKSSRMPFGDH